MITFVTLTFLVVCILPGALYAIFGPTPVRKFPKGHIHEYDPSGEYTYKHQNPSYV